MTRARIMLADDDTRLVEAFRKLLEPDYGVVATVGDGRSPLETASQVNPEVIVVDITMPLMNGLEAGLRLKEQMPDVKLLFPGPCAGSTIGPERTGCNQTEKGSNRCQ